MAVPGEIKRQPLGSTFAGTGGTRADGLGDLMKPASRSAEPLPAPPDEPEAPEAPEGADPAQLPAPPAAAPPAPPAATPAKRPAAKPTTRASLATAPQLPVEPTPAYLPEADLEDLKEAAHADQLKYDELLIAAFEVVDDDELVIAFRPAAATTSSRMPSRRERPRGKAGIQVQFRLDSEQKQWLDDKVIAVAAPSRSALIAEVLRRYLATRTN